jgi:hypothetical protein
MNVRIEIIAAFEDLEALSECIRQSRLNNGRVAGHFFG